MKQKKMRWIAAGIVLVMVVMGFSMQRGKSATSMVATSKPALTVTITHAERMTWGERVAASGSVQAWQETIVGAELGGLRLAEVNVNVGDKVRQGQLLARFSDAMKQAELAQVQAAYDEARAHFDEADANAQRAVRIKDSGALSAQELQQLTTLSDTARAQMKSAEAHLDAEKLRFHYTRVVAPDDGLISARTATVGAVVQAGAELFRLIRGGKLEWQADLTDSAVQRVRVGQKVSVILASGDRLSATVARISPVIDMQTRNGRVYVTLPEHRALRAGMFVQGEFDLGTSSALTLPQSAVVVRDGYAYVYQLGQDSHVVQVKVTLGRHQAERVEILGGITPEASIVANGAGFLSDGDLVRVEQPKAAAAVKL